MEVRVLDILGTNRQVANAARATINLDGGTKIGFLRSVTIKQEKIEIRNHKTLQLGGGF